MVSNAPQILVVLTGPPAYPDTPKTLAAMRTNAESMAAVVGVRPDEVVCPLGEYTGGSQGPAQVPPRIR